MKKDKKEAFKKIVKYTVNIMIIASALLEALDPIWGIPYAEKITLTLVRVSAILSTYLLGNKMIQKKGGE